MLQARAVRRIRELAKVRGMPLSHVADRAGVTRSYFWRVLANRSSPTLAWLEKIGAVLGVDPGLLVAPKVRSTWR